MGQKNFKGTVSISDADGRIRLRWRYLNKRYSISLSSYNKINILQAKKVAINIEQDLAMGTFDHTLNRYKSNPEIKVSVDKTIVKLFEGWVSDFKQMDCEKHTNYNSTRNMMKKWGKVDEGNIQKKLSLETNVAVTYNRRLTILKSFAKWLVKNGVWKNNPLEDINPKKVKKAKQHKRNPFNEAEISAVLDAFKNDTFTPKYSAYKHSYYYPFIYFIVNTSKTDPLAPAQCDPLTIFFQNGVN